MSHSNVVKSGLLLNKNHQAQSDGSDQRPKTTHAFAATSSKKVPINSIHMKMLHDFEEFYIKKMKEFGFSEINYRSTNKLLAKPSDSNILSSLSSQILSSK
jgi:hypothetical protein